MNTVLFYNCKVIFHGYFYEEGPLNVHSFQCQGSFPVVKCTFCRSEFQQESKANTTTICKKCEANVKQYGKPTACEYCNLIAAFVGNKCLKCHNSEKKYGLPVNCDQCKQKCAFDRKDEEVKRKFDGKLLCWECTTSYKKSKSKQADTTKHVAKLKEKSQHHHKKPKESGHNKRPNRPDVTKMILEEPSQQPPPSKIQRLSTITRDPLDIHSSEHVIAITDLKEQINSLQKQLSQKDQQLLAKEKQMTELKAAQFQLELDLRNRMKTVQREHELKVETMQQKIRNLQKEVNTLSKKAKLVGATKENGSGTESPAP
nr:EOG090X02IW [Artemia franciscana]